MSEENRNNTAVEHEYGADQIQILEGLEAVRKRPGMYIGTTSSRGLHHLVYEIVDNAVDEALAGFCDTIDVTINEDNSITVIDNGRGIPVGINHKAGIPAVEVVFTILHAGGKFGGGGYKVSGGLHGVGASVVNALSNWLEVEICQGGKVYKQRYERGHVCYALKEIGTCPMEKTGTKVTFLPDDTIFTETTVYDFDVLKRRLREMAFLTKGLRIILRDNRTEEEASLEAMSAEHENEQISELLQRAQEDAKDTSASSDDSVSDAAAKESVKDDSEAFADAFATSEESTKARTGGKIGKIHTITLENGKKQKVVEFYYEGGIKEFVAYTTGGYWGIGYCYAVEYAVSSDSNNWTVAGTVKAEDLGVSTAADIEGELNFPLVLDEGLNGRYIRVRLLMAQGSGSFVFISELQAFAYEDTMIGDVGYVTDTNKTIGNNDAVIFTPDFGDALTKDNGNSTWSFICTNGLSACFCQVVHEW